MALLRRVLRGLVWLAWSSSVCASTDTELIQQSVLALQQQFSDGIALAYSQPPVIRYGHLLDTASNDAVVVFGLAGFGGSNHEAEYLAVFAGIEPADIAGASARRYSLLAVTKIAERGWRRFDWDSLAIKAKQVQLSGQALHSGDALCCPSAPVTLRWQINSHWLLVELKSAPAR